MNEWVMETLIPKMFRFAVFHSPGLQPWVSGFPGIKIAQKSHSEGVHALPQTTHKNDLSKKGVNALQINVRSFPINPAVNGWAMETDIPKMFRFTVFRSPGLQPWVSGYPGIKIAQKSHSEGVYALPQTTHKNDLSKKGVNALQINVRSFPINPAVNGWAMETDIPKMFRFTVFLSPGLQPWVSGFPLLKNAQNQHSKGVHALP